MRRSVPFVSLVVTAVLLAIAPAASAETFTETVPRLQRAPIEKACGAMEVTATDRNELTATSTFDEKTLIRRTITGRQLTLFEWLNGGSIEIETLGTRTITRNADGTYSLVHRGTGYWYDTGTLSETPQLTRYTGTVRSVGEYDSTTFTFTPIRTTFSGVTADICEMLVAGLKARH
jgi:hypothetical protein